MHTTARHCLRTGPLVISIELSAQVHWVAFEPTPGYLSSYPFAAGIEDGVGAEAKELKWEDVQGIPEQKSARCRYRWSLMYR